MHIYITRVSSQLPLFSCSVYARVLVCAVGNNTYGRAVLSIEVRPIVMHSMISSVNVLKAAAISRGKEASPNTMKLFTGFLYWKCL